MSGVVPPELVIDDAAALLPSVSVAASPSSSPPQPAMSATHVAAMIRRTDVRRVVRALGAMFFRISMV